MFLTELELTGFKSFLKTKFVFDGGATVFIGPNGCGKSNISDAIRWVLGEQTPGNLRCKAMSDLIFAGTEKKRSSGLAEVSITLDNKDEHLPIEFDSVKITRRLFGSGESEYLINGRKCRLKDVTSLFLDTGLGVGGYSVLEQTKIDAILRKPEERFNLFEEAAGISGFKVKIADSLANLRKTDENILRLKDILIEIGSQTQSLKTQAKKAERYKKEKERLSLLKLSMAQKKYQGLMNELKQKKERYSHLKKEEGLKKGQLVKLEGFLKEEKESLKEKQRMLSEEREARILIKKEQSTKREELARCEERCIYLEKLGAEKKKRAEEAGLRAQEITQEIDKMKSENKEALSQIKVHEEEVKQAEQGLLVLTEERRVIGKKEEEAKIELIDSENQRIEVSNAIGRLRGEAATFSHIKERLKKDLSQAEERLKSLSLSKDSSLEKKKEEIEEKKKDVDSLKKKEAELILKTKNLSDEIERLMREEEQNSFKLSALAKDPHKIPSALQKNPIFLLADAIDVEKRLAVALESVLGRRITAILVKNKEELDEMLTTIKEKGLERTAFLLSGQGEVSVRPLPKGEGVIGRLSDLTKTEIKTVSSLLSNILVVASLQAGIKYAKEGWRCVTYEGEVIDEFIIEAGTRERGYLVAKILRKELEEALSSNKKRRAELILEKKEKEPLVYKILKEIQVAERELRGKIEDFQNLEVSFRKEKIEEEKLTERSISIKAEIKQIEAREEEIEKELIALIQNETEKKKETEEQKEILQKIREDYEKVAVNMREASENIRRCKAEIQRFLSREKDLANFISIRQKEMERISLEQSEDIAEEEKTTKARWLLYKELEGLKTAILVLQDKETEEERERLSQDCETCEKAIIRMEAERSEGMRIIEKERDLLSNIDLEMVSCQTRISLFLEDYGEEVKQEALMEVDEKKLKEEEERLEKIGEVNLLAIHEYEKIKERFSQYEEELEDVNKAKADLHQLIKELEKNGKERFAETFVKIKENFARIFLDIFSGGQADLVLQDGGIEIYVQPKGKRSRDIHLLSSGERSLVALCLLFALFYVRPAPFCFLDEVDSSLDESNVQRFLSLLSSLSKDTQFLIITHNKRTVEAGSSIYGITMAEPGVSSALSLKLSTP
ncbi:MAG: chromosome segregation protein SMC [bacterium]|nr:chromosome segregation protein SMC [bacterium]